MWYALFNWCDVVMFVVFPVMMVGCSEMVTNYKPVFVHRMPLMMVFPLYRTLHVLCSNSTFHPASHNVISEKGIGWLSSE